MHSSEIESPGPTKLTFQKENFIHQDFIIQNKIQESRLIMLKYCYEDTERSTILNE